MHIPVLLKETIDLLNVKKGGRYIDATLGLGGHSLEILRYGGRVLGIEVDEESLEEARGTLLSYSAEVASATKAVPALPAGRQAARQGYGGRGIQLVHGSFKDLRKIALEHDFVPCDGVLFDLGMSSWQLEESGRGFSFQKEEPLDMRMDKSLAVTAADLLNSLSRDELTELFQKYGGEQSARRVASAVVRARTLKPFETTGELVRVIEGVRGRVPSGTRRGRIHPATKVFQALRIAVNDEVVNLRSALPQAFKILRRPVPCASLGTGQGGRLAVISFHSLEDGEVKHFFKKLMDGGVGEIVTKKPVTPTVKEIKANPRARSAKLRVIKKDGKEGKR